MEGSGKEAKLTDGRDVKFEEQKQKEGWLKRIGVKKGREENRRSRKTVETLLE